MFIIYIILNLLYIHVHTDIEEITHKAGNYKKFIVFIKMLCAAFTEEKDSILYVDLLTYSDLEMLKVRYICVVYIYIIYIYTYV
jgi:hypothetical protein